MIVSRFVDLVPIRPPVWCLVSNVHATLTPENHHRMVSVIVKRVLRALTLISRQLTPKTCVDQNAHPACIRQLVWHPVPLVRPTSSRALPAHRLAMNVQRICLPMVLEPEHVTNVNRSFAVKVPANMAVYAFPWDTVYSVSVRPASRDVVVKST